GRRGRLAALRPRRPLVHLLRAIVGLTSLGGYFYALPRLPVSTVVAISFAASLFVAALSWPLLGERVGPRRVAAIVTGFAGVLVLVWPGTEGLDPTVLGVVAPSFLSALVMLF